MKLEWIKDNADNQYLVIIIDKSLLSFYLSKMENYLGSDFNLYRNNQISRDGDRLHITVLSNSDVNRTIKLIGIIDFINILDEYLDIVINVKFLGLGKVENNYKQLDNESLFVICQSILLDGLRSKLSLNKKDFHITLGFKYSDIHNQSKGIDSLINESKFIKLFRNKYYNQTNFNWIDNSLTNIIPLKITENHLSIYSDGYKMELGEIDGELRLVTKYKYDNPIKELTTIEIRNFLNK